MVVSRFSLAAALLFAPMALLAQAPTPAGNAKPAPAVPEMTTGKGALSVPAIKRPAPIEDVARTITYKYKGKEITRAFEMKYDDSGKGTLTEVDKVGGSPVKADNGESPTVAAWVFAQLGFVEMAADAPKEAGAEKKEGKDGPSVFSRGRIVLTGADGKSYRMQRAIRTIKLAPNVPNPKGPEDVEVTALAAFVKDEEGKVVPKEQVVEARRNEARARLKEMQTQRQQKVQGLKEKGKETLDATKKEIKGTIEKPAKPDATPATAPK